MRRKSKRAACRPGKCRWSWVESERVAKCDVCGFCVHLTSESLIRVLKEQ